MPLLKFEISKEISSEIKLQFKDEIFLLFSEIMDTKTDHIGISIVEKNPMNLFLGRVSDSQYGIALVSINLRNGRTTEQKRKLSKELIKILKDRLNIPKENSYVVFTEHPGEDFHLDEIVLSDWEKNDDPL